MTRALEIPLWLEPLLQKPVAVLGGGASGLGARALLASLGAKVDVFDERKGDPRFRSFDRNEGRRYGLVVFSPGFPFAHPWFAEAEAAGCQLAPELDLGASFWSGPIVAVTGTNGKTTLTEFLALAFGEVGVEAVSAGNIGAPLSRLLAEKAKPETLAVVEVSSFQAARSKRFRPEYALWTNFDEDHLDWHQSLENYFNSKRVLAQRVGPGRFLYGPSVAEHARLFGQELDPAGLVDEGGDPANLGIAGTVFESLPDRWNYLMARALWQRMGLEEAALVRAARRFVKGPHRLQRAAVRSGIAYWNDSKGTNFHATLAALARFSRPVVWIGGGKRKGGDLARFARRMAPSLASAHLVGETREELAARLREQGVNVRVYASLESAVAGAREAASSGDTILLSPGFASLDMFESYSQRGEAFLRSINSLEQS